MKRGSLKKWQFSRVLQLHSSSHNNQRRWWFSEIALYYSWEKRSYSIEKPVENNPLLMILECLGWGRLLFSVKYLFEHREGFFTVTTWDFLFKCKDWMSQKPETIQSLRSHTSKDIIPNVWHYYYSQKRQLMMVRVRPPAIKFLTNQEDVVVEGCHY